MSLTLDRLRSRGFVLVDPLSAPEIAAVNAHLLAPPVYVDAHVPQTVRNRIADGVPGPNAPIPRAEAAASECVCVVSEDALLAPYLLERALALSGFAAEYLGVETPYLYSANAFWSRPGPSKPRDDLHEFHRDADDERFLVMFTYLIDVYKPADGPHEIFGPDGQTRVIYGRAGTIFLADTSHPHRGRKPTAGERGLHWLRWGVNPRPAAYVWDGTQPVAASALGERYPADPWLRRVLAPLVTPP